MKWVGYWRRNPQIFVKDYLGVNLKPYQKLLFYMMNKVDFFMYIAARGQGKSFLIALYCIVRCILYPGTKIVLASGEKETYIFWEDTYRKSNEEMDRRGREVPQG